MAMFRRRNKLPQRKEFSFTSEQVMEDISNITNDEEQRNQLYICIDDKVPQQEYKFAKIEDFLKGSDNLENIAKTVAELCDELSVLDKQLKSGDSQIRDLAKEVLEKFTGSLK